MKYLINNSYPLSYDDLINEIKKDTAGNFLFLNEPIFRIFVYNDMGHYEFDVPFDQGSFLDTESKTKTYLYGRNFFRTLLVRQSTKNLLD
jgi:hypothetical protein